MNKSETFTLPRHPVREAVQDGCGLDLGGLDDVGVDVGGGAGLGVAEVVGDHHQRGLIGDQQAGVGVAQ